MKIIMIAELEETIAEKLIPGQSFIYDDDSCIALNRTDDGYLVRKTCIDTGFVISKNEHIHSIKSLEKYRQESNSESR